MSNSPSSGIQVCQEYLASEFRWNWKMKCLEIAHTYQGFFATDLNYWLTYLKFPILGTIGPPGLKSGMYTIEVNVLFWSQIGGLHDINEMSFDTPNYKMNSVWRLLKWMKDFWLQTLILEIARNIRNVQCLRSQITRWTVSEDCASHSRIYAQEWISD